jgi:hypothetical protein
VIRSLSRELQKCHGLWISILLSIPVLDSIATLCGLTEYTSRNFQSSLGRQTQHGLHVALAKKERRYHPSSAYSTLDVILLFSKFGLRRVSGQLSDEPPNAQCIIMCSLRRKSPILGCTSFRPRVSVCPCKRSPICLLPVAALERPGQG